MYLSNWLVFCGVGLLTTFTPGPAVLLTVANTVARGPRHALICCLGNAFGLILVSAIATAGMSVLLNTSAVAFGILKLLGAAYLIYLGIRQWRHRPTTPPSVRPSKTGAGWKLFAQGITVALTNPKAILFFSALFPQFLVSDAPLGEQFLILTATFSLCSIIAHASYTLLAHRLQHLLASPRRMTLFNRLTGGLFVTLGLGLLRLQKQVV